MSIFEGRALVKRQQLETGLKQIRVILFLEFYFFYFQPNFDQDEIVFIFHIPKTIIENLCQPHVSLHRPVIDKNRTMSNFLKIKMKETFHSDKINFRGPDLLSWSIKKDFRFTPKNVAYIYLPDPYTKNGMWHKMNWNLPYS